jgi:hypothetical protein
VTASTILATEAMDAPVAQKPHKPNYPIKPYKVTLRRLERELVKKQVGALCLCSCCFFCGYDVDCYTITL